MQHLTFHRLMISLSIYDLSPLSSCRTFFCAPKIKKNIQYHLLEMYGQKVDTSHKTWKNPILRFVWHQRFVQLEPRQLFIEELEIEDLEEEEEKTEKKR